MLSTPDHRWIILCDFDGTISTQDTTDSLLATFAQGNWEAIEAKWKNNQISSRTCMSEQIAMLNVSREELNQHLDTLTIDPDFVRFANIANKYQIPLYIISDGIDYGIQRILNRYQLGYLPIVANQLVQQTPQTWSLNFPYRDSCCKVASGTCKCSQRKDPTQKYLLIGDGQSDFCVAQQADFVFAKAGLLELCRQSHLPHCAMPNFSIGCDLLVHLLHSEVISA